MQQDLESSSQVRSPNSVMSELAPYLSLGTQLTASVVITGAFGWWLDSIFNTAPVLVIAGLCLGVIAGMVHFFRQIFTLLKKQDNLKKTNKSIQQ